MTLSPKHYDALIIGSGQGGTPLATTLARAGKKTALVEKAYPGGTCVNVGCTPTKTMVASARVAHLVQRGADYGVQTGPITINLATIRQRKRDIVDLFRSGSTQRAEHTDGLDYFHGEAHFTSPQAIAVHLQSGDIQPITADTIVINTGTRPAMPAVPGLNTIPTLDSTSIMELDKVPAHLLIIGGGYISLEFGQMFRRFGSQVTIVQKGPYLLSREDPDVSDEVAKILREDGIEVLLKTETLHAKQSNDGSIHLQVRTLNGEQTLTGSHLLVATGRIPNTEQLNLAAASVQFDAKGFIQVNEALETNVANVYAIGDVKGGPAFTHISYDDFRILRTNLIEGGQATIHNRLVPYTVFIDPQLGRVGLTETEARAQGRSIRVAKLPMGSSARALETDETRGFMKAIVDNDTQQILGCAILSVEGGEIMSCLQIAMLGKLPYTVIKEGTFAHPTFAESLNNLFMTLD